MISAQDMTTIDNLLRRPPSGHAWYTDDECASLCTRAMYTSGRKHLKVDERQTPDGTTTYKATFLRWGMGWESGDTRSEAIVRAAAHAHRCGCR